MIIYCVIDSLTSEFMHNRRRIKTQMSYCVSHVNLFYSFTSVIQQFSFIFKTGFMSVQLAKDTYYTNNLSIVFTDLYSINGVV